MTGITRARRLVSLGALATAVVVAVVGCASTTSPSDSETATGRLGGQVIWADYGGPTNESRQVAYFDGFQNETGVEVVSVPIEDAVYMSMLRGKPGDYDVFQASAAETIPVADSLLHLPADAQGELLPAQMRPFYLGGFVFGTAQGWLTETFPNGGPQSWADFFDTAKFPGKRAWPGTPGSFDASFEIALLADGVPLSQLYPLDLERATKKLDTIRDSLVFYQSYPEVQQLLSSGSAAIAVSVTGQFTALKNAGMDVTVQWNQAFSVASGLVAQADVKNAAEVIALAKWMNDPQHQATFTERTLYGPVNPAVFDLLSPEVAASVVNAPEHKDIIQWDIDWRSENYTTLLDTYTAWLAG